MKKIAHKISALSLALLVLFSTFSFTVDFHYCGNHLMDVAFMSQVEACSMEPDIPASPGDCVAKNTCCTDLALVQDAPEGINLGPEIHQGPDADFQLESPLLPQLIPGIHVPVKDLIEIYKPPGRSVDLHLMFQTFLI
ncbi:HYC_CC_PP family protein [Zeaxanthinibacter enoshimensis]|uniref:Secreted protein n=1 Tax=Zeaxanthinibacter enoshimensis TaxID=392009 RepID=A0A4R6TP22_9FLAO|nr:hypothetical protein [Zeaxanthinibacter enoshimensis]TDQ32860.1 hypothetical protein CLV82_0697 [Zeaxanthinibacter enoshimensis]